MISLPRLRDVRQRRLLSQVDLAAKSGIAASTINRIEHDLQAARYVTVRKLAAALDVAPEELMGEVGEGKEAA